MIDDGFVAEIATALAYDAERTGAATVAGVMARFTHSIFAVFSRSAFRHADIAVSEIFACGAIVGCWTVTGGGTFLVTSFAFFVFGAIKSGIRNKMYKLHLLKLCQTK